MMYPVADIAVAAPLHQQPHSNLPIDKYPNLKRWFEEDIAALPCWKKTEPGAEE